MAIDWTRHPRGVVAFVGLAVAAIGAAGALWQARENTARATERFEALAERAADQLTRRMQTYEYGLRGARGAVIARRDGFIDRDAYQRYAESRDIDREWPGVRGIGLIRRVEPADEEAFTAAARLDGWPDFAVRQITPHDGERYVIQYIEPVGRNRQAVGLDIASESNRREAADRAAQTGRATLTGPITLVQASGLPQRSFLLLLPIYLAGAVPGTPEERRAAVHGWSYAPLVINEVLAGFDFQDGEFTMSLADVSDPQPQEFFAPQDDVAAANGLVRRVTLPMYGRAWQAELRATPLYFSRLDPTPPGWVAAGGAIAALLAALLAHQWMLSAQRQRNVQAERTRRAAMVDASHDAIIGMDLQGVVTDWNPSAEHLFGYSASEAKGRSVASLLLPEDRIAEDAQLRAAVARGEPVRAFDSVRRTRAGGTVEVSITSSPVRGADGALLGYSKTLRDVSEARRAEREVRRLNESLERQVAERTAVLDRTGQMARVGGWVLDMDLGIPEWSDETCRIHDREPGHRPTLDEAIGYYVPESRERVQAAVEAGIANGAGWDLELTLVTALGRQIQVRAIGEVELRAGRQPRLFGAFQDVTGRHRLEAELKQKSALLASIIENLPCGLSVFDHDLRLVVSNGEYRRLLGFPDELFADGEATLERLLRYNAERGEYGPGDVDALVAARIEPARLPRPHNFERVLRNGTPVDVRGAPMPGGGFVSTHTDISERRRAEAELREANERFSIASMAAGIGVWEWDVARNTLVWDDGMYRLYGCERNDAIEPYSHWIQRVHPDDAVLCEAALSAALRGEKDYEPEFRAVLPDGSVRHLRAAARVIRGDDGAPLRMTGVNIDITERKTAELELRATGALLRSVLDAASEMSIIATAPDHKITVFNRGAERMLGYGAEEVVRRRTPGLIHDADELRARSEERAREIGRPLNPGEVMTEEAALGHAREWTFVAKDGRRIPVSLVVTPMRGDDGELLGYLGISQDVTQQKQAEASLRHAKARAEQANQAKSQFLANMSHEIRTPMNAVLGMSYLLGQTLLDAPQADLLGKITMASKSLLGVINDILDLSKIEAGELSVERVVFSLPTLLAELAEVMAPQAHAKRIVFRTDLPDEVPPALLGDPTRLRQILTNLLSNAIKFTERGGVELTLSRLPSPAEPVTLRFAVRDSGIGIAPDVQARLFSPFAQADASTTRRFGGTGLGLSIVKRLADLMGGQVGVQSSAGAGSEFWVVLPFAAASVAELPAPSDARPARGNGLWGVRVLVVDDSDINLEVARRILELEGAKVAVAINGLQAFETLQAQPEAFDVVLMDVQMPVLDGHGATRRIRAELPLAALPIIALTAGALTSERQRAVAAGMDDFVSKPFDAPTLVACIRKHVEVGVGPFAALLDAPAERPASGAWPEIEGIDARAVRARLADDLGMFRSMLRRLLAEFADLDAVAERLDAGALDGHRGRMHKLRGGAGTLGAVAIAQFAGQAEAASEAGEVDAARRLTERLAVSLAHLREAAAHALAEAQPASPGPLAGVAPLDAHALGELVGLLREQSLNALDVFESLSGSLEQQLGAEAFGTLRAQVEGLQFDAAVRTLQDAASTV